MKHHMHIFGLAIVLIVSIMAPGLAAHSARAAGLPAGAAAAPQATCTTPLVSVTAANRLGFNQINALDAATASDVWAVGNYFSPTVGLNLPLTEHWTGSAWSLVPQAVTTATAQLRAVSVVGASDVWAVGSLGSTYPVPLTEHWDGHAWHLVTAPNPGGPIGTAVLNGVAAVAANDVWAVGVFSNPSGGTAGALLLHWDGTQWSLEAGAGTGMSVTLNAIAALGPSDVWAAGSEAGQPLLWHWNGSQWSNVPITTPSGGTLYAVAARATGDVWAVGTASLQTLTLHWDGSQVQQVASPSPANESSTLTSVAIVAANDIWAVGYASAQPSAYPPATDALVEHWNGTAWSLATAPVVSNGRLNAAVYPGSGGAWIGGSQDTPSTLLARRSGSSWQVTPSSNPGRAGNYLVAVDAAAADDIWAVGDYEIYPTGSGYATGTLSEHWDGQQWSTVPIPNPGGGLTANSLSGVAALAHDNAWTVGSVSDGIGGYGVLIEHWNGAAWQIALQGNAEATPQRLNGVAAVSATNIWAVGATLPSTAGPGTTLIEHWNGSAWSTVSSPNLGGGANELQSIAVVAANDIWAAGVVYPGQTKTDKAARPAGGSRDPAARIASPDAVPQPLLLHWNGTVWSVVPAPAGVMGGIQGLAASGPHDVWAVGYTYTGTQTLTLTLHWDGTAWHAVSSPSPSTQLNVLRAVTATAANDAWAVGYARTSPVSQTLLYHWDGHTWTRKSSANPGHLDNYLLGLVRSTAHDLWAVGFTSNGAPAQALTLHAGAFSDVQPTDYYYAPVNYLLDRGAVSGYGDCTYKPGLPATRAQLVKMIVVTNGWTLLNPATPHFSDVPRSDPYYRYIETAYAHGIVTGYSDGKFHPADTVTRGQASKMVVLARGWALQSPATAHFHDVPVGSAFYSVIETAYAHHILSGYADGNFHPARFITRGQAAKIVYLAVAGP